MPAPAIPLKVPTTLATEYKEKVVPALKAVLRGADRDMIPIARAALIALQPTSTNP